MDIEKLYKDLTEAYSDEQLNLITGKLISLYRNKNFDKIRELANQISEYVRIDEELDAKCFTKLIMLYHPDKGEQFRKEFAQLYKENDHERLIVYSHIFLMTDIDIKPVNTIDPDIDYSPDYVWDDIDLDDGFSMSDEGENYEDELFEKDDEIDYERSFYNMIKIKEYGNVDVEFPSYYLEDFEEFEMSNCGMESLEGVEYCIHMKILDVSNNALHDLSDLAELSNLEEIYLANNQIGYIDALSNLTKLRIIDLSGNQIDDISPIFDLDNLEYVNLIGNLVSKKQIETIKKKGVLVTV